MKKLLFLMLLISSLFAEGQIEYNNYKYNLFTPIIGTDFVIATFKDSSKKAVCNNRLLFINTPRNQKNELSFARNICLDNVQQIKIDSLRINGILVAVKTHYIGKDKFIDLREVPTKILMFSTDGKEQIQITPDDLFVSAWDINYHDGVIRIIGFYDLNKNGKNDKADKEQALQFDLKTIPFINNM